MEKEKLKIDGIFDRKVFEHFLDQEIYSFTFDLRPKSFNFIQQYVMIDILKSESSNKKTHFTLKFENEKNFLIEKFIQDVSSVFPRNRLSLMFTDCLESSFYDQFNIPYFWHFEDWSSFEKVARGKKLKGIIIRLNEMIKILQRADVETFLKKVAKISGREDLLISLTTSWQSDFEDISILEVIPYFERILEINDEVIYNYRILNFKKSSFYLNEMTLSGSK